MRTHGHREGSVGHREGSVTHWDLLGALWEGQWEVGKLGRDNMGRNARYR